MIEPGYERFKGGVLPNQMVDVAVTLKELLSFLEGKNDIHASLVKEEIRESFSDFADDINQTIVKYKKKCLPILEGGMPFPALIRDKRDEVLARMVEDEEGEWRGVTSSQFVSEIAVATRRLLGDSSFVRENDEDGAVWVENPDYRGLDSDRDTEEEVENIIRTYPEVHEDPGWFKLIDIQNVSFIPLVTQLRIELFGTYYKNALLRDIVSTPAYITDKELFDVRSLDVLRKLREMGVLKKRHITEHDLMTRLCVYCEENYFPVERFRFLSDWDPDVLMETGRIGYFPPLHRCVDRSSLLGFLSVFEAVIRHFPNFKGFLHLFERHIPITSPFKWACNKFGREKTLESIKDILNNFPGDPYDPIQALLVAATNEHIDLDCVYFVLRREPDLLAKLLPSLGGSRNRDRDDRNGSDGSNGDSADNSNDTTTTTTTTTNRYNLRSAAGKRKREAPP